MHKSFLLRFQESEIAAIETSAQIEPATELPHRCEQADVITHNGYNNLAKVNRTVAQTTTKTSIKSEKPDQRASATTCCVFSGKQYLDITKESLTFTCVNTEQPRRDERRRASLVLPACS